MKRNSEYLPIEHQLLKEAVDTQEMFKADKTILEQNITGRTEQIKITPTEQVDILQTEQVADIKKLWIINGGLSVLQHLITIYRAKIDEHEKVRGEK